jgi:hypothetical protein
MEVHHAFPMRLTVSAGAIIGSLIICDVAALAIKFSFQELAGAYLVAFSLFAISGENTFFEEAIALISISKMKFSLAMEPPLRIEKSFVLFCILKPFYGTFVHIAIFEFAS